MDLTEMILLWLFIVLATHSISHTLATQKVFKPVRDYLAPRLGEYWGELVRYPFCIAHWIALLSRFIVHNLELVEKYKSCTLLTPLKRKDSLSLVYDTTSDKLILLPG